MVSGHFLAVRSPKLLHTETCVCRGRFAAPEFGNRGTPPGEAGDFSYKSSLRGITTASERLPCRLSRHVLRKQMI
jgi:hypothetical protein